MKILRYDGKYRKTRTGQLYMATNGDHPDNASKGVMLPSFKFANIEKYIRHQSVCDFLATKTESIKIFKIAPSDDKQIWEEIDNRNQDYSVNEYKALYAHYEQQLPEMVNTTYWIRALDRVLNIPSSFTNRLRKPYSKGLYNEELYRELLINESGILFLEYLLKILVQNEFNVKVLSKRSRNDDNESPREEGKTYVIIDYSNTRELEVSFKNELAEMVVLGKYHINKPLWRVKHKSESKWSCFFAKNLSLSNELVEYAHSYGVEPFKTLVQAGQSANMKDLFQKKLNLKERLTDFNDKLDIQILGNDLEWKSIESDDSAIETISKIPNIRQHGLTQLNNICIKRYGYQMLSMLLIDSLHPDHEVALSRTDLVKYMEWCDKITPEFIDVSSEKEAAKPEKPNRIKRTSIEGFKRTKVPPKPEWITHCQEMANDVFMEQWEKIHGMLGVVAPSINIDVLHDSSNKQKEFSISVDDAVCQLRINSGCNMYKVPSESEERGIPTITYNQPKFGCDSALMTLDNYLMQKAAEEIASYITDHENKYAKALIDICEEGSLKAWKKQSTLAVVQMLKP